MHGSVDVHNHVSISVTVCSCLEGYNGTIFAYGQVIVIHDILYMWWSEAAMAVEQSIQTRIAGVTTYK